SAKSPGGEKVSWSSSSSSWASSVVSAIRSLLSQQRHGSGASPRRPHVVPLVACQRLLGAQAGLRSHEQLLVRALRAVLAREDGPEPAAEKPERDRDDARVGQLPADRRT